MHFALLSALVGLGAAVGGLWLTGARRRVALLIPINAGMLAGLAVFAMLPELALEGGAWRSLALFGAGYLSLFLIDRYVHPVCPACAHDHDHGACAAMLHGFAGPLVTAGALHSFLDGWGMATAALAVPAGVRLGVPLALTLHKIPEGLALGGILRVSVASRPAALGWCSLVQGATALGGAVGLALVPRLGSGWLGYPLGLAAGWLFFLGLHALHGEWRRRVLPALAGAAGVAALQAAVRALIP